ncbi:MAG: fumarylacetoacetate hydrolase family protein [Chitinophagaceae bacterium]|nr:fumarylacetoacetate hydrolase family protein [Chitinophagaceae bacterium]
MKVYNTDKGIVAQLEEQYFLAPAIDWDKFVNRDDISTNAPSEIRGWQSITKDVFATYSLRPPIGTQEVWAAGVTYLRSRDARMEESKDSGGDTFYDKVYEAERPEIFFKSTPHRVVTTNNNVRIRKDSSWNVPEPELTLFITSAGKITGYTIGNDMSSRSIEGENPLYLPQAKSYDGSTSIGPCIYFPERPIPAETEIAIEITRGEKTMFVASIAINRMKRRHDELVGFLYRECSFPTGCFLMTGTGIVPANDFTLASGDVITITIDHIGTLVNTVE